MSTGRKQSQAVAIALSTARKSGQPKKKIGIRRSVAGG
jgi:hypothetical protein